MFVICIKTGWGSRRHRHKQLFKYSNITKKGYEVYSACSPKRKTGLMKRIYSDTNI